MLLKEERIIVKAVTAEKIVSDMQDIELAIRKKEDALVNAHIQVGIPVCLPDRYYPPRIPQLREELNTLKAQQVLANNTGYVRVEDMNEVVKHVIEVLTGKEATVC